MQEQFSTQRLDHLGIVAGLCQKIGLIEHIDEHVGPTNRHVSVGQATQAMVLNGLGFVSRPLYLTSEFFRNKPVDILISPDLEASDFTDDSLGRALDALYESGLTELFASLSAHALSVFGLRPQAGHLDTTSLSFQGNFAESGDEPAEFRLARGYSKDGRPDLKQAVVSLICAYKTKIPMWFQAHSGNSSDKTSFPETIERFLEQLGESETPFVIIADSALYSEANVKRLDEQVSFITRVPATLSQVKKLYAQAQLENMTRSQHDARYHYEWHASTYGGVEQRWLLVHSEPAAQASRKALDSRVKKEETQASKALKTLGRKRFGCEQDARNTLESIEKKWSHHRMSEVLIEEHKSYSRPGRPSRDEVAMVRYSVKGSLQKDEDSILSAGRTQGFFVLATNITQEQDIDADSMLSDYKAQNGSVERGFRFLKDPMFFADGLYLKNTRRIMAMLMVMSLCLLVYALAEHHLRNQLLENDEFLPDQKGKPSQRITMRRLFQMFDGIDVLLLNIGMVQRRQILNLKDVHNKVLRILGQEFANCYVSPG